MHIHTRVIAADGWDKPKRAHTSKQCGKFSARNMFNLPLLCTEMEILAPSPTLTSSDTSVSDICLSPLSHRLFSRSPFLHRSMSVLHRQSRFFPWCLRLSVGCHWPLKHCRFSDLRPLSHLLDCGGHQRTIQHVLRNRCFYRLGGEFMIPAVRQKQFKHHWNCLTSHTAFLPAPQTICRLILMPAPPLHSISVTALVLVVVSQRKGKTFAAPRFPKCGFYHKAHLVKLTPLWVALQRSTFKQTPHTQTREHSYTHCHSCAAKWPTCLPLSLCFAQPSFVFTAFFCPFVLCIPDVWGCTCAHIHQGRLKLWHSKVNAQATHWFYTTVQCKASLQYTTIFPLCEKRKQCFPVYVWPRRTV